MGLASLSARSQPSAPIALRFERARGLERCPGEARLREEVRERLGYDPFVREADREVSVRLEGARGQTVLARIALSRGGVPGGSRELKAARADCEALVEATALALSIAVDPLYGTRPRAAPSDAPAETALTDRGTARDLPPPSPRPASRRIVGSDWEPPPAPLTDDTRRLIFEVGAGAGVGLGAGPGSLLAGSVTVGARSGLLSLHLEGLAEAPGDVSVAADAAVSGGLYSLAFQPCVRFWAGRLLMGRAAWATGCGIAAAGAFLAGSQGLDDSRLVVAPWLGFGGRATLDVALLHWLALRLAADVIAPVTRISLTDPATGSSLWVSPVVAARGGILLVAFLP